MLYVLPAQCLGVYLYFQHLTTIVWFPLHPPCGTPDDGSYHACPCKREYIKLGSIRCSCCGKYAPELQGQDGRLKLTNKEEGPFQGPGATSKTGGSFAGSQTAFLMRMREQIVFWMQNFYWNHGVQLQLRGTRRKVELFAVCNPARG